MGLVESLKIGIIGEREQKKLLAFLYYFDKEGVKEVSITELLDAVRLAQEKIDFGYKFSSRIFYSSNVFEEIERLRNKGYLKRYTYKYNGYFPMNYIALTPLGFKKSKEIVNTLQADEDEVIRSSVKQAIKNLRDRYKIWIRKLPKKHSHNNRSK